MTGGATGNAVTIGAVGGDTAIPVILSDKGGGGAIIESNGLFAIRASAASGSTSYLNVQTGTPSAPLSVTAYGVGNQDLGLSGSNAGLVRLTGALPGPTDASTAVATTIFVQATAKTAVGAMIGNRYKIPNVGTGANISIPVPSGVIDQMIVEVEPNSATIATMTLTMPATSAIPDGFIVHFISTNTVTTLTVAGNSGQTVAGPPTTIGQTSPFALMWDAGLNEWLQFR